ncbi:hypothetical protein BB561_000306 [Smittium simulii]|uniref:dolichol kinase n=1 Tax=Smittium simulii TaxID=133385 RepID=A0A2T9YZS6_9FUNG|nr:hypothetical protein BB561_000306 [Smittium simulii]
MYISPNAISLALGIAFFFMFVSEYLRANKVGQVSIAIDKFYASVIDEKDSGKVIMSHIYLLFGCSFPIWLEGKISISSFSGLLAVGVADAIASIVGTRYGKRTWFKSKKTIEGTVGFIASLILSCFLVDYISTDSFQMSQYYKAFIITVLSTLIGLLEAVTLQNDNLMLTMVFYGLSKILL